MYVCIYIYIYIYICIHTQTRGALEPSRSPPAWPACRARTNNNYNTKYNKHNKHNTSNTHTTTTTTTTNNNDTNTTNNDNRIGRGDDTVGSPHRAQISQFELFELTLLLKLYNQLPVEQFEATASQSTVPSPLLITLFCIVTLSCTIDLYILFSVPPGPGHHLQDRPEDDGARHVHPPRGPPNIIYYTILYSII